MEDSRVELEDHLGGNDIIIEERIGQSDESFKIQSDHVTKVHQLVKTSQSINGHNYIHYINYRGFVLSSLQFQLSLSHFWWQWWDLQNQL